MRARTPDRAGVVQRDSARVAFEVFGEGEPALLLVPATPITHARSWKGIVPALARQFTVVTTDGRGTGRSDRPPAPERHAPAEVVADILAVLDAAEVSRAVLVAHCHAIPWALRMAGEHPERAAGVVAISPGLALTPSEPHVVEAERRWTEPLDIAVGWSMRNRHFWRQDGGYRSWIEFFFGQQLPEPHSTKQYEDTVGWALETDAEAMIAEREGRAAPPPAEAEELCRQVRCPVRVLHGSEDRCQPVARAERLAELTGGDLIVLDGSGHLPQSRDPVKVARLITEFTHEITGTSMPTTTWTRGPCRQQRALYLSSPIGLGHARRDVAVAKELKRLRPEVEIDWLAQHPVTTVLEAEGENIHPASQWLASESAHVASESAGHDLHCFQALRRMDEILVANFMVFQEVVEEGRYDLVIGDEAWDVDYYWHENPELKRGQNVWLTDFVGYLPMPDGGEHEAFLTTDYNAEMIEHIDRYPWIRDQAIFVGNDQDIVPDTFGGNLPSIRDWTTQHFSYSGYITGFSPPKPDEVPQRRADLGYRDDELVCVVAVGGSGVGRALIEKVVAAYPLAKKALPELRMIVVTGPRIDPAAFPKKAGLELRGYVHRLYQHLSVCDLAIVQGGLTTTMELTAAKRPFMYFPLGHHFEQNFHVRHRLDRYDAGECMDYATTDPDLIAARIAELAGKPVSYCDVEADGAARAAKLIAEFL
ncbi:MAG: alpha/beta fold hydrolase [Nocardiopsaceae bacterium]|jgi:pimeloyl-ACP methyl ester carboxylesterase/predicted glycosyltransferase|nr:alpha/beta fold hydrolase [Nocardiopsaceae bacterium]